MSTSAITRTEAVDELTGWSLPENWVQQFVRTGKVFKGPFHGDNGRQLSECFEGARGFFGVEGRRLLLSEHWLSVGLDRVASLRALIADTLGPAVFRETRNDLLYLDIVQCVKVARAAWPERQHDAELVAIMPFVAAGYPVLMAVFAQMDARPKVEDPPPEPIRHRRYRKGTPYGPGVYFIQAANDGLIKIGMSKTCMVARIETLRSTSPVELKFLAALPSHKDEIVMHKRFSRLRVHGEWFKPGAELMEFIASLAKGKA